MSNDFREFHEKAILLWAERLLDYNNCAEYTHDNGVVSVRVARSGVQPEAQGLDLDEVKRICLARIKEAEKMYWSSSHGGDERGQVLARTKRDAYTEVLILLGSKPQATPDA